MENFFVKHLDYIANPTIEVKCIEIVSYFTEYIMPRIGKNEQLFQNIKKKIEKLNVECYFP